MIKKIPVVLLGIMFLISRPIVIHADVRPPELTVPQLITKYSQEYGVNEQRMYNRIKCESSFNENAVGDGGHSFGLVQIYLPAHPEVTKEQALDKEFAIQFMAESLSKGKDIWSCSRILGYK